MKTFKKYMLGAAILSVAVLTGCKDKMRELNTNPDIISSALPEYQFLGATYNWGWFSNGWARNRANQLGGTMQQVISNGNSASYVNPSDWSGGNMSSLNDIYSRYYNGGKDASGVKNLNSIVTYIDQTLAPADRGRYQDIRAIARILQTHETWTIFTNYGAMVYSEAFKVREGITYPAYDIYNGETAIYKQLDDTIKMCIQQLSTPKLGDAVAMGAHDGFYGFEYTTDPKGGATFAVASADVERGRWLKLATTLRLKMAVAWRQKDNAFYKKVLEEVRQQVTTNPNALMSVVQDGCQYVLPDSHYDTNENNQLSFWFSMPVSYINSMKLVDDPRLPLVANPNYCDTSLNLGYKFIRTYWPDSLKEQNVYDEKAKTWTVKSWGDRLKMGNIFQGHTVNPGNAGKPFGPGTLIRTRDVSITVRHPQWQDPNAAGLSDTEKKAREDANALLTSISLTNDFTGQSEKVVYDPSAKEADKYKVFTNGTRSVTFRVASGIQSRNYVLNTGGGGWAGPAWDYDDNQPSASKIKMVTKVLPYAEHCFLMALVCNYDGGSIGSKDAQGWYEEGIRASMQETQEDAERVYVKICTNPNFPLVAPYNGTSNANKRLYKIEYKGADFDNYVAKPQISFVGGQDDKTNKIMIQMWLASWQKSENLWYYYKLTGYPRTVNYSWETSTEAAMPTQMGFEQPYTTTDVAMLWPRHVNTPQPQLENMPKWYDMQKALQGQTDPAYAPHGWGDYSGRVFWDVVEPAGLQ